MIYFFKLFAEFTLNIYVLYIKLTIYTVPAAEFMASRRTIYSSVIMCTPNPITPTISTNLLPFFF